MVGILVSILGMAYFQGRTFSFKEGYLLSKVVFWGYQSASFQLYDDSCSSPWPFKAANPKFPNNPQESMDAQKSIKRRTSINSQRTSSLHFHRTYQISSTHKKLGINWTTSSKLPFTVIKSRRSWFLRRQLLTGQPGRRDHMTLSKPLDVPSAPERDGGFVDVLSVFFVVFQ